MPLRCAWVFACAVLAGAVQPVFAQLAAQPATAPMASRETTVYSPRADDVSVTIYRDGLALITETRTVELPELPVTLVIENVVDTLLAQSAVIADLGRSLAESDFDFDRLTPRSLLESAVGQAVTLTRTNPVTGRVTRVAATVLAVGDGVMLQTAEGGEALYCSGLPERLELDALPAGLFATPRLSVKLAGGQAGERTVKVSYLAHGFDWSADYVARLNERANRMDLTGWATLTNESGTPFVQAEVLLVAGRLNVLDAEERGSRPEERPDYGALESPIDAQRRAVEAEAQREVALLRDCFATAEPVPRAAAVRMFRMTAAPALLEEFMVTGASIQREQFGDYHLYRLPWRTDLGARQTKQALFLDKKEVEVERFYGVLASGIDGTRYDVGPGPRVSDSEGQVVTPRLHIRWENTERTGLGEPLPQGYVRVFEPYGDGEVFAGQKLMDDRPVGEPVELELGRALNIMVEARAAPSEKGRHVTVAADYRIVNDKRVPIDIEVRHRIEPDLLDFEVERTSRPVTMKSGMPTWRFEVEPGEDVLSYVLSANEPD